MPYFVRSPLEATRRVAFVSLLVAAVLFCGSATAALAANGPTVTIMQRNMFLGSDLDAILAATDQASFVAATAATLAEIRNSNIPLRAAGLADEIAAAKPDLISLEEVTLWRTGPMFEPPATEVMYDQLDLLLTELKKRNLHYAVFAVQNLTDIELPVPAANIDLRYTDRDAILARIDQPQSEFDVFDAQTHRYAAKFTFGSDLLGQLSATRGWMSVQVVAGGSRFRFVNTHLESTVPGVPQAERAQVAQALELTASLALVAEPVIIAGDFNSNAEPGPEHTPSVQRIEAAGFADAWDAVHPGDPGYTWPLFGENMLPATPNERIDLVFTRQLKFFVAMPLKAISAERIGVAKPAASGVWTSDHAGLVVTVQLP